MGASPAAPFGRPPTGLPWKGGVAGRARAARRRSASSLARPGHPPRRPPPGCRHLAQCWPLWRVL